MCFLTQLALLCIGHVLGIENLALHKPTWERYPWPDRERDFGSENAVDGMYFDRGTKENSSYIERIAGFFVFVSNTTSKDDGYLCYHDKSTERNLFLVDQHINCTLLGRYVIYYNERRQGVVYPSFYSEYAFNELCEVEVYGCNGTFGDNCIYPCPQNCLDMRCDTDTGHCLRCVPGYKGPICNQVRATNTQLSCTIVIVLVSVLIVVTGSMVNFVIWKRNAAKINRKSQGNIPQPSSKREEKDHQYTELEEVDKSKTYEEIHNNSQNLDRIAGFFVYVSNTTSKDDGYLCYHDELTDRFMLSEDQHINCTLLGRYVIYYNERKQSVQYPSFYSNYAYNELCEVEVYGCKGIYGDDCIYPCPANCKDRRCDTNAGHCLSCSSGYKGLECHIVCNNNTYGPECALKCGNCSNGETCHHINGTCLHGCAEGALGDTCQEVRATDTQTSSCTETYTIVIVMVSVLIVVTGSLINFVIWKRNVEKLSIMR
uniref:EGF-like domain-containing protein n=1 Tax=Magallana gigas TaxID=29159 RepID=A0A8W8P5Z9_MAGGI